MSSIFNEYLRLLNSMHLLISSRRWSHSTTGLGWLQARSFRASSAKVIPTMAPTSLSSTLLSNFLNIRAALYHRWIVIIIFLHIYNWWEVLLDDWANFPVGATIGFSMSRLSQFIWYIFNVGHFWNLFGRFITRRAYPLVEIFRTASAYFFVAEILYRSSDAYKFFQKELTFSDLILALLSIFADSFDEISNSSV